MRVMRILDSGELAELSRRPTSAMPERTLLRGHDRVEPCVCGGEIRVQFDASSEEIREAVASHNASLAHRTGRR